MQQTITAKQRNSAVFVPATAALNTNYVNLTVITNLLMPAKTYIQSAGNLSQNPQEAVIITTNICFSTNLHS